MCVGRRELAGLAVVAVVVAAGLATDPERALAALVSLSDRPVLFGVVLLGIYAVRPFLAWPTMAVSIVVGYVLGPWVGLPVALAGAVITSLPAFYLACWFRTDEGLVGRLGSGGRVYFRTAGDIRGVAAARLMPIPADTISAAAGLAGVRFRAYAAGTLVGELPWTVAAVVIGSSARTITEAGTAAVSLPLLAVTSLAAVVLLAGPLYRMLSKPDAVAAGG